MEDFASRAQQYQNQEQQNKKREGDVTIDYTAGNKKQFTQDTGEYVDFEEIKE